MLRNAPDRQELLSSTFAQARPSLARIGVVAVVLAVISLGILIGINAYTKSRQVTVRIDSGIVPREITTTARTVGDLLKEQNLRIGNNDEVSPPTNTRLTPGMVITVDKAMIVFITSHNEISRVYMTGGTVAEALAKAKIEYDQDDEITPALDQPLTPGLRIRHVAVSREEITERHIIPNETVYLSSSQVLKGKNILGQKGRAGVQNRVISVTFKDGVEVSRMEISNATVVQPQDRVIYKGTKVEQVKTPPPSKTPTPGKNTGKNTGKATPKPTAQPTKKPEATPRPGVYDNVTKDDLMIPSVPSTFDTMILMDITAYTHTGHKTASGNWPQYTRTREKPGTIAVNFSSIPKGTLLYVTGYGYCVAEDTGSNKGDSSRLGDVFMNTLSDCIRWGRRRGVKVYIVQSGFSR
jgi:3D (Asp-Asp-Asp) domain-containing protein